MRDTITTSTIVAVDCAACGVLFGLTALYDRARRHDHETFRCPNGHSNYYPGPTPTERERDQVRRELAAERERLDAVRSMLTTEKRLHAATKGQLTKTRKRVGGGVCPCCQRSFVSLARHMATKHPDYADR